MREQYRRSDEGSSGLWGAKEAGAVTAGGVGKIPRLSDQLTREPA